MAYADSGIDSVQGNKLEGSWVHDVYEPLNTARQFIYASGVRTKNVDTMGVQIPMIGRQFPMVEFGIQSVDSMSITVVIPNDIDHDDQVRSLRELVRLRTTLCYRDGRGELMFGVLTSLALSDDKVGTTATMKLEANNYTEGD